MTDSAASRKLSDLDLLVALPAYNEDRVLRGLIDDILNVLPSNGGVLVVDDGSGDSTADIAQEAGERGPVALVRHGVNKGLGEAVRTLLHHGVPMLSAKGKLVLMDADATHTPDQIRQLKSKADEGFDLVICSRYAQGGRSHGVPGYRRVLSQGARVVVAFFLGNLPARDLTSGYRMYDAALLRKAVDTFGDRLVTTTGFGVMVELLAKLSWIGARVAEVPLILRYDLKKGASKMKLFHTLAQYMRLMFTLRAQRKALLGG